MKRLLVLALAPLLLAACDRKPAAPAPAPAATVATPTPPKPTPPADAANFQHDAALDLSGFYFTDAEVKSGNWKLKSLNIGAPSDFAAWEDGKRPSQYGPIFLEFEDVTSPTAVNELGQTNHTVSFRLLPDSYRVDGHQVVFHAKDARIGEVVLSGVMDVAKLQAAKTDGPSGGPRPVLTGDLQIGADRIRNLSFVYFPGE